MTSAIRLYEELAAAPDDKARARIIAEAFERMEERYPEVKDLATRTALTETGLQLQKEIELTRKEMAEAEGRLRLEIEAVRKEVAEMEGRLRKEIAEMEGRLRKEIAEVEGGLRLEIEAVRKEIAEVRREVEQVRGSILRWVVSLLAGQTVVLLAAFLAIARGL